MTTYTAPTALTALADALTVPDGGFTVNIWTNHRATDGYAVSVFDVELNVDSHDVTPELLGEYLNAHAGLLTSADAYFGGWTDPHTMQSYLDVSIVVDNSEDAEKLARDHGQLAYFSLGDGESIRVTSPPYVI